MNSLTKQTIFLIVVSIFAIAYSSKTSAWIGTGVASLKGTRTTDSTNLNQTTAYAIEWSSSEFDDFFYTHDPDGANPERLVVDQTGDYLISITLPQINTGEARTQLEVEVYVNGTAQPGSIGGSSYLRNNGGHSEASNHVTVLLEDLTATQYIEVFVRLTGIAGTVTTDTGISAYVEHIDETARTVFTGTANQTTAPSTPTNLNQTTAYELQWTESREDAGFTHSDVTNPEDIQLDGSGYYNVFFNFPVYNQSGTDRQNIRFRMLLDGGVVNGGHATQGLLRDNSSYNNDSSAHWSGVVLATTDNQILSVDAIREANSGTTNVPAGKVGSIYVEKLDDGVTGQVFLRGNDLTGGTDWDVSPKQAVEWEFSDFKDTTFYTHSTTVSPEDVEVEIAGDYLLVYNDAMTSTTTRAANKITVEVDGSEVAGAETKTHYMRQTGSHNEASGSLVYLLEDLLPNQVITVSTLREAANATTNDDQDALLFLDYKEIASEYNTQLHYRWRDDTTDLNTDGGWLAAEDTAFDSAARNTTYRLRVAAANVGETAEASAKTYELQWGELVTTCGAISTWTGLSDASDEFDLVTTTHITPDGESTTGALLANAESYTYVNGEGREVADTTGSIGGLSTRNFTELEFSLQPTSSASLSTSYCFRLYDTTAGATLDNYDEYAVLTVDSPVIEQLHHRWRDDTTDLNTGGGWLTDEDSNPSTEISIGDSFRLRTEIANTGSLDEEAAHTYELQWGIQETTCAAITTWTGMSDAADDWDMILTTHITPDQEATTGGLLANSEGYTFFNGEGLETVDTTSSLGPITGSDYTELEFSFNATASANPGATYCFKVVSDVGDLQNYPFYPVLTIEGGFKVQKITGSITGTTSQTESISDPLASVENAFIFFDFTGSSSAENLPSEGTCTAYISSTTQVTVEKSATAGTCEYVIYVVEALRNEFRVRGRGEINLGTAELSDTGTANGLSDIIDLTKAFVPGMARSNGNGSDEWRATHMSFTLDDATTVTGERGDLGTSVTAIGRYEVVEFLASGMSVQTGEEFLDDLGTTDQDVTLDTTVTTGRSFVYATFRHIHDGLVQTSVRTWLKDGDTVSFDRAASGAYDSYARWYVIEFPSGGASAQRNTASLGGTNNDINISITDVELSRSFPVVYGSNSGAGNAFPRGKYWSNLDASDNLNHYSGYSGNTYTYAWQVIDTSGFVADPYTFVQNDFEYFETDNTVTLTNNWPPGNGEDLLENEVLVQIPATNETLDVGDQIRVQMNTTILGDTLPASTLGFQLQYRASNDCTVAGAWTDVGDKASGEIWRLFDEAAIGDSTAQVNNISTSDSSAEGYYSEINPTANNPNEILVNENTEWDWPIENNGAAANTTYCFRMILDSGDLTYGSYRSDSYPQITTAPGPGDMMRHGKFFKDSTLDGYFWAN